jgi:Tol biopolymer transport system component
MVANDIAFGTPEEAAFSVSNNGVLSYRAGDAIDESELIWIGRDGTRGDPIGPHGAYGALSLSPDETSIAVDRMGVTGQRDIWLLNLQRGSLTRFTNDGASTSPVWGPNGTDILFGTSRVGPRSLHTKASSGGEERVILSSKVNLSPMDWSRDGQFIIYQAIGSTTKRDLWALRLAKATPQPILQSVSNESQGCLSPNGRWLAYISDESGTNEIYLCSFPDMRNKQAIATGMGPKWSSDGSELFYLSPTSDLMSVPIVEQPKLTIGRPQKLFHVARVIDYEPSRDGRRFLITVGSGPSTMPPITVVVNWEARLTR